MTGTIYFNGKSSQDFGLIVEQLPPSVHASRRGDSITVPGRNGVILREDGSFDTYTQEYIVWFSENETNRNPYQTARDIAVWLLGASGFCRLEDTFEPEHYRLARFSGEFNVDTVLLNYGKAVLSFDVQPQRYLKSGENAISYEGDSSTAFSIVNPTQFEARPLLKFVDTSVAPDFVQQTLTWNRRRVISSGGAVTTPPSYDPTKPSTNSVTAKVNCSGKGNARIIGNGYAFYDSNGSTRSGGYRATGYFTGGTVVVPDWAETIVVSGAGNGNGTLALQDKRANPGASAVTINGTTVNLDFSEHDIIYLDCDLHDAYYADGSNANAAVSFASDVDAYPTFPSLASGENIIIPGDGSNLDFELTPRWWTL